MNIREAKQEIINTVKAYTQKDETGAYLIPPMKQRPILLIGPPGIGKTAIMEQAARECGINLVSYTITHHTRQSAIGLPYISKKNYGGREYQVTEYTMSEIIASVYDQIELSGISEGILFLDEINCVSETLAPTMLQFLQYKTFGSHKVPDGFIIVTAGNPPQYNRSVRDFDIVTLDRVRRINVEEDFQAWKEYAYQNGIHGSIMAYLEIRKENFYSIRTDVEERYFVTARGWEDLSGAITVYEKTGMPVTQGLVSEYLQDPGIASDFATYYELYNKYKNVYRIPDILDGHYPEDTAAIKNSPFDEKLSLISLLIDSLNQEFRAYAENAGVQKLLHARLGQLRGELKEGRDARTVLKEFRKDDAARLKREEDAGLLGRDDLRIRKLYLAGLEKLEKETVLHATGDPKADFAIARDWFTAKEDLRQQQIVKTGEHLTNSFEFMSRTFGEGQEMVIFLSELTAGSFSLKFVTECGNEAYYKYNRLLLLRDRRDELREEILKL